MAAFPYIPTQILSSPTSEDEFYILQSTASKPQLLALSANHTLNNTALPCATISPSLPFLSDAQNTAYTAAIDDAGNILVFAGGCKDGTRGATYWQFTPDDHDANKNGTWKEMELSLDNNENIGGLHGANYLASAISFQNSDNATSEMFIFGGMCPNSTSSNPDDWQQAAEYSNRMLVIDSAQNSTESAPSYQLGISTGRGPPIAEAGYSVTPLQPTFSDRKSDSDSQARNQNFVLLGGHTQQAFINMSQVAMFSLPEQSWAFLPVDSPAEDPKTDLTMRNQNSIDSRSGHTALLTSDGKRVVVFGGWVGDVNTPADPQLAVLEIGEDYGGSGDWQWSTPNPTGPGLPEGSGIFGHGAVMLTGDVMMVIGGYRISAPSSRRRKRVSALSSTDTFFFNTTSSSWITSYRHPKLSSAHSHLESDIAGASATNRKVGLGVGLTLGLLAIIVITAFYFWYKRRLKHQRNSRGTVLRHQLSGHSQDDTGHGSGEMSMVDSNLLIKDGPYPSNRGGLEAERTGLLFEIPSPTRGLRRSLHSRGTYQPTSRFPDGRKSPGFSTIHPIDERDEYDEEPVEGSSGQQHDMLRRDDYNILSNVPILDPFHDPISGSRTPSPQSPQDRELEIRNWVSDWSAADAMMHSQTGRMSPEKTDRTSSTLSDQSVRSALSSQSVQQSVGSISRSISQRSAALFSATAFRLNNEPTPMEGQQNPPQRIAPRHRRAQSLTLQPSTSQTGTTDTFTTAATSFSRLQTEGEALLGDHTAAGEPPLIRSQSRARGWMGSMRRAFTGMERSASTSPENNGSTSSSPIKANHPDGGLPRRAASTGGMFWQKRQGARDWDAERNTQEAVNKLEHGEEANDDEWDVESAVERRVVQVMFTVPKEKLRVVNRGPDGDGESILSADVREAADEEEGHDKGKGKEKG